MDEDAKQRIVDRAAAGVQYKEIAKEFGVGRQHVGQIAIRNGIRRNNQQERAGNGISK